MPPRTGATPGLFGGVVSRRPSSAILYGTSAGPSLDEFGHLVGLLQRFAENDLNQFDSWQVATSYGPVCIQRWTGSSQLVRTLSRSVCSSCRLGVVDHLDLGGQQLTSP
jgi:hypothetical protein